MSLEQIVTQMDEQIYQNLLQAVETGKWANGQKLTEAQQANSLQLIMLWQAKHNHQADHLTINCQGEIELKSKSQLKQQWEPAQLLSLSTYRRDKQ